jgi:hypothetical protein
VLVADLINGWQQAISKECVTISSSQTEGKGHCEMINMLTSVK